MTWEPLLDVETPLGWRVRTSRAYWEFIVGVKHPALRGRERDIIRTLADPDHVRRSRKDANVYLFYRSDGSLWLCAVARCLGESGFLITAYPTDSIKIGSTVWKRSS